MLVNGAKLEYKASASIGYIELLGLKELPDMGIEPEKVENTTLADKAKQYELGTGDAGDLVYKFKYDNTKIGSPYRILRKLQSTGETVDFKETLKDGTTTAFKGQVSVKRTGGGVNDVIEFEASIALQSDLEITDPEDDEEGE